MQPGEAIIQLSRMGFRFRLDGEAVRVRFEGQDRPNPHRVTTLLDLLRQKKEEVREFLRCHCPRCGGVVYGIIDGRELCMACHYNDLRKVMPGLDLKH